MNTTSSITIKNDNNKDLLKIEEVALDKIDFIMEKESQNKISKVDSILQELPGIGMTVKHSQSYIATFSKTGNIMKSNKGELKAILTNKGKTTEIAKLSRGVNLATLSTLAFQVANIVASQKHLEDINEKLEIISKDIKEIKEFLEHDRLSKIQGNFDALQDIKYYIEIRDDSKSDELYKNQIESIERETKQILHHLLLELNQFHSVYKREEKPTLAYVEEQKNKFHSKIKESMLLMSERVVSSELKLTFNPSDKIALKRLEDISKEILKIKLIIETMAKEFKNDKFDLLDKKLKYANSNSKKGAMIGGAVGSLVGPWGTALGASIGLGIGGESEKEKKKRIKNINRASESFYDDFIYSHCSWITSMQNKINTLKNNIAEDRVRLLVTTDKRGYVSASHIIKEKVV